MEREAGWYWCKRFLHSEWSAALFDGEVFDSVVWYTREPYAIGPKIEEPEEETIKEALDREFPGDVWANEKIKTRNMPF